MSRIRSIKPDFWTSEQILECSRNARLLFIGLWNFCDDEGRHPYSTRQAKAEVFPGDDLTEAEVSGMLSELERVDLIRRYEYGGKQFFFVTGWKHQRIDKPRAAKYPDPFSDNSKIIPGTLPPDRIGEDRIGEDRNSAIAEPAAPADEDARSRLFREGKATLATFGVSPKQQGSMIGRWLKDCRDDETGLLAAIQFARDKSVADPVAWITAYLNKSGQKNGKHQTANRAFELAQRAEAIERGEQWAFEGIRGHRPNGEADLSVPELPG